MRFRARHPNAIRHVRVTTGAAVLALVCTQAQAGPVGTVSDLSDPALAQGYTLIDTRPEPECLKDAPERARCLPAEWLFDDTGELLVTFHVLRWLLGTIGLSGDETLVVAGPPAAGQTAKAVAGLAHLAGQAEVFVLAGTDMGNGPGGAARSFSREVVYTAPIRDAALIPGQTAAPMITRMITYATKGGRVVFPAKL
ncbi:rhodanese-like domain-containing protein [Marimonas lutisalis]|uniref:hypothetical protein n=1 Tax=Marimonas lutisalis TaxID=2545756 RepID=UPI0010F894A9|nr:hypothetical protein [Marimonas lutisalis]